LHVGEKGERKLNDEIEIEPKEPYRPPSQGSLKKFIAEKQNLILIGAGVLIVVLIFLFSGIAGKEKSTEVLVQLEKNLAAMEQKIATLEKKQENLTSGPIKNLTEKVEMLEKRPIEKSKPPASPKTQATLQAKRYYEVKKGETLTGIAKRYRLSVEELRRKNNLSPKTALVAGQKLIVSSGGKN
jgi:LysM repeat protein